MYFIGMDKAAKDDRTNPCNLNRKADLNRAAQRDQRKKPIVQQSIKDLPTVTIHIEKKFYGNMFKKMDGTE